MAGQLTCLVDGFRWPNLGFPHQNYYDILALDFQAGDLVVATYPKSGTNWCACIINEVASTIYPIDANNFNAHFAFVDKNGVAKFVQQESPRMMFTHVPPGKLPISPLAKYFSVVRNPFDCVVSYFEFMKKVIANPQTLKDMKWDDFFQTFLNGETAYGDFFDHVLTWYPLRRQENVLFLIYEDMKEDHAGTVEKIARFMGPEFQAKLKEPGCVEKIVERTTVDFMKKHVHFGKVRDTDEDLPMVRKGVVGDFRNALSQDQVDMLRKKMEERLEGTELLTKWLAVLDDRGASDSKEKF